ncbi:MAG TPA: hypothetical protein VGM30_10275 [Puia sp.]|jgi:hypothetical protein
MKYEFKVTGTTNLLTLAPETNLEREFFNQIFSGDVEVKTVVSVNSTGEVTISKKEKETVKEPVLQEVDAN